MNKLLVTLLIGIMSTQIASAQLIKSYGIKAAFTSANQTSTDWHSETYQFNRRNGLNGAIFAEWLNVPYVSVVTQVEYSQRGTRNTFLWPNNEPAPLRYVTVDNRLDYLSLLPLLKVTIPLPVVRPYLFGGPRCDILLGFKSTLGWYGYDDFYNSFNRSTYGVSVGLGVELASILPVALILEGRYNADIANAYSSSSSNVRNNAYDIWLGVAF
ncbi:MAG: outer membrane beta-barrel protein [Bacteroidota bacterium]|jgi:hypothetical protein